MIPVNTHLETVQKPHQRRVQQTAIKEIDDLVAFDPQLVAALSRSEIPYELAKSYDIYSFSKPSNDTNEKRKKVSRKGFEPVHFCGNAVPIPKERVLTSTDVINYWHKYYDKLKAKRDALAKLPSLTSKAEAERAAQNAEIFNELKWDEYALSLVSKNMQEYIVFRATNRSSNDYHRLTRSYISKHGRPKELDKIELIDDLFDEHGNKSASRDRQRWIKEELSRLMPVVSTESNFELKQWPDGHISAVINKQAKSKSTLTETGRPRLVKSASVIEIGRDVNTEAQTKPKRARSTTPPPKFAKELVSGSKQLYSGREKYLIDFSSGRRFVKQLQPVFPKRSSTDTMHASTDGRSKSTTSQPNTSRAPSRGHRRWVKEPNYLEDEGHYVNRPYPYPDELDDSRPLSGKSSGRTSAELDSSTTNTMANRERTHSRLEKAELVAMKVAMANDWRNKWRVNLADTVDSNELLEMLADLHPFTRVRGIVSVTYIAHGQHSSCASVPNYLLKSIECMVASDPDINVRKSAAICLASLSRFSEAVSEVLLGIIRSEKSDSADKWSAAQGLAHNQVYTSDVIGVFLQIYVDNYSPDGSDDPRRETALQMIKLISSGTALAAGMAGELLANSDWSVRVSACHIIGACHGPLPADVVAKLSQLMWTDWGEAVRVAAAHALGTTGHGLDVHHELVARLKSKNGAERARALRLIAIVGLMTVRLMPLFLECFRDTYTDVREAACSVAARLYKLAARSQSLLDASIAERIIEIMHFDTASTVRLTAIGALEGCLIDLSVVDPPPSHSAQMSATLFKSDPTPNQILRDKLYACLVWCAQTAAESQIRLKALLILRENKYGDHEFTEVLRQRLLAEQSEDVRKELQRSLEDCLERMHSSSYTLPLLGDLRKNIRHLSNSTMGIVTRLEKHDKQEKLKEFKKKHLFKEKKSK